jgi:hypothetical protein
MKFGVVRNVAGNIEALREADRIFDSLGVEDRVCLGQIVGVYPYVDDCVRLLDQKKYSVLRQAIDNEFTTGCHFVGWSKIYLVDAVRFARNSVSKEALDFIANLPKDLEIQGVGFQGLAPGGNYLYQPDQVRSAFAWWPQRTVIHAAESDPYVWREDLSRTALSSGHNQLDHHGRLLISTGGVGSIYEGSLNTGEATALVYDDANRTVEVVQPACDVTAIFDRLRATDYPRRSLNYLEDREYRAWRR